MLFEVYNVRMGLREYDQDSFAEAAEKAADEFNEQYDLELLRGGSALFAVRQAGTTWGFKWFNIGGYAIPVYKLDAVQPHTVDELIIKALNKATQ